MNNRYLFLKRIFPKYIILERKNNKIKPFNNDKFTKSLKINNINKLNILNINYIIVENITIINKKKFINNNYNYYLIIYNLSYIKIIIINIFKSL